MNVKAFDNGIFMHVVWLEETWKLPKVAYHVENSKTEWRTDESHGSIQICGVKFKPVLVI